MCQIQVGDSGGEERWANESCILKERLSRCADGLKLFCVCGWWMVVKTGSRMIPKFLLVSFTQMENSGWESLVGVGDQ